MPSFVIRNKDRGHVDHGWLQAAHMFSFARYVNPDRMNFGALLVLNEDTIAPGQGFGEHFHDNMEIVTIPLQGALRHADSLGNGSVIRAGDVQIMSAGTGIMHSEVNASETEPVHLLQIWILPNKRSLKTRYEQSALAATPANTWQTIVSPTGEGASFMIHQDAWMHLARCESGADFEISSHVSTHGLFLLIIDGSIEVGADTLTQGDAYATWDERVLKGRATSPAHLLAIEVPMG